MTDKKARLRRKFKAEQDRLSAERGTHVPLLEVPVWPIYEELAQEGVEFSMKDMLDVVAEEPLLSPALFEADEDRQEYPRGPQKRRSPTVRREDVVEGVRRFRDDLRWVWRLACRRKDYGVA